MEKRSEHLEWCKQRANEYVEQNDLQQAFASFFSDMRRHDETKNHMGLDLGLTLLMGNHLSTQQQMKTWINGFN